MSLLDCVCCPRHRFNTAIAWDDLEAPSVETYSSLVTRSGRIACYLRHLLLKDGSQADRARNPGGDASIVGLCGTSSPEVVSALLGILAVPAAYVPLDLSQPERVRNDMIKKAGLSAVMVHYTHLQVSLSNLLTCRLSYLSPQI